MKCCFPVFRFCFPLSRPARGAWIEMVTKVVTLVTMVVAPRTGRVD